MFVRKTGCYIAAICSLLVLAACGSSDQKGSQVAQLIDISVTTQSVADTRSVYAALRTIYDSTNAKGTIPADQLFSILAMKSSERQKLASAYPTPLNISCNAGICSISGQGQSVSAQTEVSGGGINRPVLGLSTAINGTFIFTSNGLLRACGITGVTVRKLFITKQVQGVEIEVSSSGVRTVVDAGDSSDNFDCRI
jgi:hypothetical protein